MTENDEKGLLTPGQYFGDYKVLRYLGKGGMGVVYLVEHPDSGQFAVKIVDPQSAEKDPEFVHRFAREGAFAMDIRHPNLIAVYEMGQDPETGYYFLVMDYMPGGDVAQRLRKLGQFSIDEAVRIVAQVANALVEAHAHGVVHRDIKPGNIMFDADGTPKLADLGVAKFSDRGQTMLTSADVMIGTPAYMAPEQITDSHGVDARADIYALGMVFFEMLAGKRPNEDMTVLQIVAQALEGKSIPDVRTFRPDVPAMIAQLLNMMCMPKREMRIGSARQVVTVFNRILGREPAGTDSQVQRILDGTEPSSQKMRKPWGGVRKLPVLVNVGSLRQIAVGVVFVVAIASIAGLCWFVKVVASRSVEPPPVLHDENEKGEREKSRSDLVPDSQALPTNDDSIAQSGRSHEEVTNTPSTHPATVPPVADTSSSNPPQSKPIVASLPPSPTPLPASSPLVSGTCVTVKLPGNVDMELVYCAPGSFVMGSVEHDEDECSHEVKLSEGFWIGRFEVTQRQWSRVMKNWDNSQNGEDCPVVNVSWDDCQRFCRTCGEGFRLPTEAEWEYACRAGGEEDSQSVNDVAWYRTNSNVKLHSVGGKKANKWGISDCRGNVWEWCADWYGDYPKKSVIDPQGPKTGEGRVVRGGCYTSLSSACRGTKRSFEKPSQKSPQNGFRLCCSASAMAKLKIVK